MSTDTQMIGKLRLQLRRHRKQLVFCIILMGLTITLMLQTQPLRSQSTYYGYMPAVKSRIIAEPGRPACRWPHTDGQITNLYYTWGNNLQAPGTPWRVAFESAVSDWYNAHVMLSFFFNSSGSITLNTFSNPDPSLLGRAIPGCSGTTTTSFIAEGNSSSPFNDSENIRRSTAGHELGHTMSIGHVAGRDFIALMSYNIDPIVTYIPQQVDVDFVYQFYR